MAWFDFFRKGPFASSRKVIKRVTFSISENDYDWLCPELRFIECQQMSTGSFVFDFHYWEHPASELETYEVAISECDVRIIMEIRGDVITKVTLNRSMLIQDVYYQGHTVYDLMETSFQIHYPNGDLSPVGILDVIIMTHFNNLPSYINHPTP